MFLTLWYVGLPVRRTMTAPAVAAALLVFSALPSCQATPCVLPQPGKCSTDNSSATNNNKVCGLEAGNCRFTSKTGLCSYQQGCADQGMSNWTANQGRAEARQKSAGSCGLDYYYSVLESPWLNFSHVSCLKFSYLRTPPSALDVFLDRGKVEVLTILNRSDNADNNKRKDMSRTINPGIGKVLFRAYGGGGGTGAVVKVFKVSVEPGICTWSGEFLANQSTSGTESSNLQKQTISPLISPTEINKNRTDCLRFRYRTQTSASQLTVSIQPHLEEQTSTVIWNYTSSGSQSADISGVCPIQVNASFKIIFTEHSSSPGHQVNVSIIKFRRWQEKKTCRPSPSGASTSATDTVINSSDTVSPASSGGSKVHEGSDDFNSTVLPAIVAAIGVVLIIVIIIIVVLLIRRRRRSKRDQSESPTQRQDQSNGVMAPKTQDKRRDSYSEIRASHFDHSTPVEDSGYFESDEVARHSPDPEIDPYEQIPEDTSRDTQDPEDDDYSHISARGYPDGAVPPEIAEDDYHHISTPESAPKALASSACTQVQKKGQPAEKPAMGYAYTQVNKKGKKMAVQDTADLNNAYSKTSQKPAVAPKPGHRKGDGNTATTETQNFDDENLDGVSDTYNRINASATSQPSARSPYNRPDPDTDTYNRIDMATGSGKRGPSPSVDVDDDYNSLDFDNTAQGNETSTNSYDHVCSNPDDDYSRADGGKKLVVMDSSYDRVRFFDA